jgi:hypothetical protein
VSGSGTFNEGTSRTVTATASSGYRFINWTESGSQVSTSASYQFTLNGNRTLVANFEVIPATQYTISVSANNSSWGSVSGGGTFNEVSSQTVTATANSGYRFVNWTESGIPVSSEANYTFTLNGNRTLVANFEVIPATQYTISVSANDSSWGSVSGGGTFNEGSYQTVTATANAGYRFVNWTESGIPVSSEANYTFTLNGNRTLVANFKNTTAIESIETSDIKIRSKDGMISVDSPNETIMSVKITDLSGRFIKSVQVRSNQFETPNPHGLRIAIILIETPNKIYSKKILLQ